MFFLALTLAAAVLTGCAMTDGERAREERVMRSPAWGKGKFHNRPDVQVMTRSADYGSVIVKFIFKGGDREPRAPLPTVPVDLTALASPPADGVRATWLGHSTVWVEVDGVRVLCDPHWSERSSPVGFAGPKRFHAPAVKLDDLPVPDLVVISHDHYDHLDRPTIEALNARGARFAVPLGVGAHLQSWGVPAERIVELDWWERAEVIPGRLAVTAAPAQHFSGRGLLDRNDTLWASWVIEGRARRVYFGGDGGLNEAVFTEIGRRFGPFDLTLLEIGAYDRAWGNIHLGPENAIVAHRMLRGNVLIPIHWGTFNLGLHAWHEPPEQILAAAKGTGTHLALPRIGEGVTVGAALPSDPWWRALIGK